MTDKNERAREIEDSVRRADAEREEFGSKLDKLLSGIDAMASMCDALGKRMDAVEGAQKPKEVEESASADSATERAALADAQMRCDGVALAFGERAPPYMSGELSINYRRRLLRSFQRHSPEFATVDLSKLDGAVLDGIEKRIYADAVAASDKPESFTDGIMRERKHRTDTGHNVTSFHGSRSFVRQFTPRARAVVGFGTDQRTGANGYGR